MNYERKRNRNSYLYYVIYEGPQLCSLLGEIRGLKRSQKNDLFLSQKAVFLKLNFNNTHVSESFFSYFNSLLSLLLQEKSLIFVKETSLYLIYNNLHEEYILYLLYP